MRCSGTGAPPVMKTRMAERSAASQRGERVKRVEQVGVPEADRDPLPLDQGQDLLGIAGLRDDDRPALEEDGQHVDPGPARAEERRDRDRHVVVPEVRDGQQVDDVPRHVGMRQHHSLRPAARARGVREHAQIAQRDVLVDRLVAGPGDELLEVDVGRSVRADDDASCDASRERHADRGPLHHDDGRREPAEQFTDRRAIEAVVHRRQDGSQLRGGEERLEERRVIGAEPADPIPVPDAEIAEPAREAPDPVRELGIRAARLAVDQRGAVGRDARPPLDPGADAVVLHPPSPSRSSSASV